MGIVCSDKGELHQALEYYNKSPKINLKILGENHREVASIYNNMGVVYKEKYELDKAIDLYNRSLGINLNTLGENHVVEGMCYTIWARFMP